MRKSLPHFLGGMLFFFLLVVFFNSITKAQTALQFNGSNQYVTFGAATSSLGVTTFTLECWVKRSSGGVTMSTGTNGFDGGGGRPNGAYPVLTKGMGEGESPKNINTNFFLGITIDGYIGADFEDSTNGGNHPVWGVTQVPLGEWHHIAATFNGRIWNLFLDGNLDKTLDLGYIYIPEWRSIQHAALGTGINSSGGLATGRFSGSIDEPRIWSVVRTQAEIQLGMNSEITSGTGLKARWGLNDGNGTIAVNSVGGSPNGTLTNGPVWVADSPFNLTKTFQQGVNSYFGTTDTYLDGSATTTIRGNDAVIIWDTESSGQPRYALLKFDNIFGIGANQIPQNVTILSAKLRYNVTDVGNEANVYESAISWNEAETFNSFGGDPGVQSDEYGNLVVSTNGSGTTGVKEIDVTSSLFNWSLNPTSNNGWIFIPTSTDGVQISSREGTVPSLLTVNYSLEAPIAPLAPSSLTANAGLGNQIQLNWSDNSNNETGFRIERSYGVDNNYIFLTNVSANTTSFSDPNLNLNTEYFYRVRAYAGGSLVSSFSNTASATTPAEVNNALKLLGTDSYVKVNDAGGLGLTAFTLETWFRKEGSGISVTSGTSGIPDAIPLITKGTSENEAANIDINYFLCIKSATNVLGADFEEGAGGTSPSLNHPILGVTTITNNVWHHGAVTYDGTSWKLYLDGNLENTLVVGQPVASTTASKVALGSSLTSTDGAQGFFNGSMDEIRIWNYARTQTEIQSSINAKINSTQLGLIARWSLDEGTGATINGSAGTTFNGSIVNTNYQWVSGAPFNATISPSAPLLVNPANGEQGLTSFPTLTTTVSDNNSTNLTVRFYGREAELPFKLIGLPDTQNYPANQNGGSTTIFNSQTQWIRDNAISQNIVYVSHLGDIVNTGSTEQEWINANTSLSILEPSLLGYPYGIPYGTAIGNHDQLGGTTLYNNYFGVSRFSGRSYYGGHYGSDNNNHYDLFSSNGMNFIVVYIRSEATAPEIAWADGIISANATRRAILISHNMLNTGDPGTFAAQGQAIYDVVKDNPNLFLMLCGHVPGEGKRIDTFNGNNIYTLLSDYQNYTNGGNGYLRIMEFLPSSNQISVKTYSPYLNQYESDASSQFTIPYTMSGAGDAPYVLLSTSTVPNNGNASYTWNNLSGGKTYEWYVTITDQDGNITTGPTWTFSTEQSLPVELSSFAAKVINNKVHLNWGTTTEVNNFGFEVERKVEKSDVNNWEKIGFINGGGNSNSPKNYSFIDTDPIGGNKFHYRLKQIDNDGKFEYSNILEATLLPNEYELYQNYPNPFNPSTKIKFSLPKAGKVSIKIYDITGAVISELTNNDYEAGYYDVELNASALGLASGIYFYQLRSGDFVKTNKMILMK